MKVRLVILLVLLAGLGSCAKVQNRRYKIAALLKSSTNPFFALMWEGIKGEAFNQNVDIALFWPKDEADFAYQEDFLKNQANSYDALIFAPSDGDHVANTLRQARAHKKELKVVLVDTDMALPAGTDKSQYYDAFIATDNEKGGKLAASFAMKNISSKSHVAVISGFDLNKPRTTGFESLIRRKLADVPIYRFIADFDRKKAYQIIHTNWKLFRKVDVVFCANDHMALGVVDAYHSRHSRLPTIIGYDSVRAAHESMLRGELAASVVQFPSQMGQVAVTTAVRILRGEPFEKINLLEPLLSIPKRVIQTIGLTDLVDTKPNEL